VILSEYQVGKHLFTHFFDIGSLYKFVALLVVIGQSVTQD